MCANSMSGVSPHLALRDVEGIWQLIYHLNKILKTILRPYIMALRRLSATYENLFNATQANVQILHRTCQKM